ncbi:hypothetical protein BJX63DRAFT_407184 [Aspergillus granulosus]|uniref:Uncharacterized protein n=1 Tax=Aspergillus granulosus TaxID=176169 RepID=A0ABR4H0L2_9EURO
MGFRAWLYRKWFRTDDDIKRLEAIGGSFATSMFMILISLPRGENDKTVKIPQSKGKRRACRSLCQQKLRQVRELYEELNKGWPKETDAQQPDQQTLSDRDALPERRQLLSDRDSNVPFDVYELEDTVAANEHDDLEKTGISVTTLLEEYPHEKTYLILGGNYLEKHKLDRFMRGLWHMRR